MNAPSHSQGGFVLPLTLVAIAVMAMALWAALAVLSSLTKDVVHLEREVRLATAASQIESRLLYLWLTEPSSSPGLTINGIRVSRLESLGLVERSPTAPPSTEPRPTTNILRLDDSPYLVKGIGGRDYLVSIQDDAGLFNIATSDEETVTRYLMGFDVDEVEARQLAGALADYIDQDDLTRLNGAEKDDYKRAGLTGPSNAPLRDPLELYEVWGWDKLMNSPRGREILSGVGSSLLVGLRNINTASRASLAAWFALEQGALDDVLEARRTSPLLSVGDITRITGVAIPSRPEGLDVFPSRRVRLSVYDWNGREARQIWQSWLTRGASLADRPYFVGRTTIAKFGAAVMSRSPDGDYPEFPESQRLIRY